MHIFVLTVILPLASAYIVKKPGNIPDSFILDAKKNLWACPINNTGVPPKSSGSFKAVRLKVSPCYSSSWNAVKCPWIGRPRNITLKQGGEAQIVDEVMGWTKFFHTVGLAKLVGDQVCVSWHYIKLKWDLEDDEAEFARCEHSCFTYRHGPVYTKWDSGPRSFTADLVDFEVVERIGNSARVLRVDWKVYFVLFFRIVYGK